MYGRGAAIAARHGVRERASRESELSVRHENASPCSSNPREGALRCELPRAAGASGAAGASDAAVTADAGPQRDDAAAPARQRADGAG